MEYRKQAHAVYYTRYHIVLSTKYRRKILKKGVGEYLEKLVHQVTNYYPDIEVIEVNTNIDHIHMMVIIPPKYTVSRVVQMIKANTGKKMREKFEFLDKIYWGVKGIWSIGYFVSTVGINEETIREYIQLKREEDSGQAKHEF
jgi:putative transposase